MRRALDLRDGHCQGPGCRVPTEECTPHHVKPWSLTRRTELDGLRLYRQVHHARLHPENHRFRNRDRDP
jgi:hypothetical protein